MPYMFPSKALGYGILSLLSPTCGFVIYRPHDQVYFGVPFGPLYLDGNYHSLKSSIK